jgi:hypothetical protein
MKQETQNPILVISDKELGERLGMKEGSFYVYYKPSFINGFEGYLDKDINFSYL